MEKFLTATSTFIEKSTDTRYFLLFFTFLLFTDTALCLTTDTPLIKLTYSGVLTKLPLGVILSYMALFLCYISLVIPLIAYILRELLFSLPNNIFSILFGSSAKLYSNQDYISLHKLKQDAADENNSVKFNIYIIEKNKNDTELKLYQMAFSLLITMAISFGLTHSINNSIFYFTLNNEINDTWGNVLSSSIIILFLYCITLGISGYCIGRFNTGFVFLQKKSLKNNP